MARQLKASKAVMKDVNATFNRELGSGRREELPIDHLVSYVDSEGTTNDYLFGPVTEESVQNLKQGIEEDGFKGAINVWALSDKKFMIFSGHRRAKAMELLGKATIPCFVYNLPDTEEKRRYIFLRSNILSRGSAHATVEGGDIYIARQMDYLGKIKRASGYTGSDTDLAAEIAKEFDTSKTTVVRYTALLSASDRLIADEGKGIVPLAQAAKISKLPEDDQADILSVIEQYASNGTALSRENVDAIIDKVRKLNRSQNFGLVDDVEKEEELGAFVSSLLTLDVDGAAPSPTADKKPEKKEPLPSSFKPFKKKRFIRLTEDLFNTAVSVDLKFSDKERKDVIQSLENLLSVLKK